MERIFISSLVRGEMGVIRHAARDAVESLDMRPVMFETEAASDESSRRALLDRVASCDALLLLLGAQYGEPGKRGTSPTEEEFDQAREQGIDVLALVRRGDREPAQKEFLTRVRGSWEEGRLAPDFSGATDVGMAVVRTLNAWRQRRTTAGAKPAARDRALHLAREPEQRGWSSGGSKLRVVTVPVLDRPLLDAVALRDPTLTEDLAAAARASRLVPQSVGITPSVGRDCIGLELTRSHEFESLILSIGFDGAVVAEGPVGDDGSALGGSVVMADRAREVMESAARFATAVWIRIDARDEVGRVLVTTAVPEAQHKVYALEPVGSSMGMSMSMPRVMVAPSEPLDVRRAELTSEATLDRLQAELQHCFELERAIHPSPDRRSRAF